MFRRLLWSLAISFFCFIAVVFQGVAAADTISVSHEIKITGIVLPSREIVINQNQQILKIVSNTGQAVIPTVYQDNIALGNERPLTAEIYGNYQRLLPKNTAQPGLLYEKPLPPAGLERTKIALAINFLSL